MSNKKIFYLVVCIMMLMAAKEAKAQKYFSRTGEISFFSKSLIENIEANSNSANTVIDSETGNIQWAVLIKSFEF